LTDLFLLFIDNLLPIFLAAGTGYLLSRWLKADPRTLSQVTFYIFSPCLVFTILIENQVGENEIIKMLLLAWGVMAVTGLLAWLTGQLFKLERKMLVAVMLTSIFMNSGNFGMSFNLFAFGQEGLAQSGIFFVSMSIATYTVGIFIASMGRASPRQALVNLLKVPAIYAVLLAVIFLRTGWKLPLPIQRTTQLLGDAAIPAMLVLLGMQLSALRWGGQIRPLILANGLRLLIAPLVAFGLVLVLGLAGVARQVGVLEASMPSAVLTIVLATEYEVEAAFVSAAVFTSTLASAFTLTPLLAILKG
jgi:malate permease and related proteins